MDSPRIAIFHTDPSVSSLLVTLLEEEGYIPLPHFDFDSTLDALKSASPDLAIVELAFGAPQPTWALASAIRSEPLTQHIPIIALTTSADVDQHRPEHCRYNCELIPEPFDINIVLGAIRSLLKSPQHCHYY